MAAASTDTRAGALAVHGARLYYEIRGAGPLLALHAAPMDSASFVPAADLLAEQFTVLTGDPRGIARSEVDDPDADVTPDQRADDLARVIEHIDAGPAVVFGSSGGAVSALALVERHPDLVTTVVAHEPPLAELVDDREELRAAHDELVTTYLSGDRRAYWADFLTIANIQLPEEVFEAIAGTPIDEAQAADERFAVLHMDNQTTFWQPDLARLRAAAPRIVIGIGEDSTGQLCDRTSRALAAVLGIQTTFFPGDHIGFAEDPAAFASRLRAVLAAR
jgi:pimeloyl-ACP methyl ester carboxylesterase